MRLSLHFGGGGVGDSLQHSGLAVAKRVHDDCPQQETAAESHGGRVWVLHWRRRLFQEAVLLLRHFPCLELFDSLHQIRRHQEPPRLSVVDRNAESDERQGRLLQAHQLAREQQGPVGSPQGAHGHQTVPGSLRQNPKT